MNVWRLIISGKENPSINMGIDFALWKSVSEGKSSPVLRFYQWMPSSISIGYNQNLEGLIDVEFCKKNNIHCVKRPTGGSAIFHDIELTYSFSAATCHKTCFLFPLSSYIEICKGIKMGIQKYGINLQIRGYNEGKEPSYTKKNCFSLSSRHDLVFDGKKLVGSAQRRNKNSFLQHGSILIEIREKIWEKVFIEKVDFSKITCLRNLGIDVKLNELEKFLKNGFENIFEVEFQIDELTEEEKRESLKFAEKYFGNII